ncbi:MAG: RNA 2',3'-cyclic phosphodiesterase [Planctomycetes bacterium]|nr:RNA 2',3'-cyclic phosphodiesterase [Planctomycetota bacterium]
MSLIEDGEVRAFLAIELDTPLRETLDDWMTATRRGEPEMARALRWVEPNQLHVTLRFLGNRARRELDELAKALAARCRRRSGTMAELSGIGAFPVRRPRVLWVGVEEGRDALIELYCELSETLSEFGVADEERPFSPHVTLARVRAREPRRDTIDTIRRWRDAGRERSFGRLWVQSVTLFESQLRRGAPPAYRALAHFPLCS